MTKLSQGPGGGGAGGVSPADLAAAIAAQAAVDSANYARGPGVIAAAPAPLVTAHVRTVLDVTVSGQNPVTGRLYGVADIGTFRTSDDNGTTWTEHFVGPFTSWPGRDSTSGFQFDVPAGFMYMALHDGTIARNPIDVWTTPWTIISPPVPAGTTSLHYPLCIPTTGVLLYGNYNADAPAVAAKIWRSTDGGATWAVVYTLTGAKHVHAIQADPRHPGWVWASVGDAGTPGIGIHLSKDNGLTWEAKAHNRYGISMAFPVAFQGAPEIVALEADGLNEPHAVAYRTAEVGTIDPLAWFDKAPTDPACTRGTPMGIVATPHGDLVYCVTSEGGTWAHAGIYVSQGPTFQTDILLEDLTGVEPAGYTPGFVSGNYVFQGKMRFTLPTFAGGTIRH